MKNIQIKVLNPDAIQDATKMMAAMARLTQHGEKIHSIEDFEALYEKPYSEKFIKNLSSLPHPTLQKFGVINVIIVGASRRFLAQITRHQNEVKFMSASLQYSDFSDEAAYVVPYGVIAGDAIIKCVYDGCCESAIRRYKDLIIDRLDNDSAGYIMPQALRNVLLISATPYQWKHMIEQRVCRRNTDETRIVMLKIWEALYDLCPALFGNAGPFCTHGACQEVTMSCGLPIKPGMTPTDILKTDYPKLFEVEDEN